MRPNLKEKLKKSLTMTKEKIFGKKKELDKEKQELINKIDEELVKQTKNIDENLEKLKKRKKTIKNLVSAEKKQIKSGNYNEKLGNVMVKIFGEEVGKEFEEKMEDIAEIQTKVEKLEEKTDESVVDDDNNNEGSKDEPKNNDSKDTKTSETPRLNEKGSKSVKEYLSVISSLTYLCIWIKRPANLKTLDSKSFENFNKKLTTFAKQKLGITTDINVWTTKNKKIISDKKRQTMINYHVKGTPEEKFARELQRFAPPFLNDLSNVLQEKDDEKKNTQINEFKDFLSEIDIKRLKKDIDEVQKYFGINTES